MTDDAFHEDWYSRKPPIKHLFLLIMMANNLECRIAKIEAFSLSLPSFMKVRLYAITMFCKYLLSLLCFKFYFIPTNGSVDFESIVLDRCDVF